jgi:hypothetical protein
MTVYHRFMILIIFLLGISIRRLLKRVRDISRHKDDCYFFLVKGYVREPAGRLKFRGKCCRGDVICNISNL